MEKKRILVIAAHPDDEILGCGGLMGKEGLESHVLILTDGGAGRYDKEKTKQLKENALKANLVAGARDVCFESFPNQALETVPLTRIIQAIESHVEKVRPQAMYIHHGGDLNLDHRIVHEACLTAARPMPGQVIQEVYAYNVPSSTEWRLKEPFVPNVFVDIKDRIDVKIQAMNCYETECHEFPHPRSQQSLKTHAAYWGLNVGLEYAEPFILIRGLR